MFDEKFDLVFFAPDEGGAIGGGEAPAAGTAPVGDVAASAPAPDLGAAAEPVQDVAATAAPESAGSPPEGWPVGVPYDDDPGPGVLGGPQAKRGPVVSGLPEGFAEQFPEVVEQLQRSEQISRQFEWLNGQMNEVVNANRQMQLKLQEYETAGLDDEERARRDLQAQRQYLEQQQQAMSEQMYRRDLHGYYSQFVPADQITGDDPAQWQDSVLRHLAGRANQYYQQNQALRKALKTRLSGAAPKVTAPGGGPASPKRSVFDMSFEEREQLFQRALRGELDPSDIPGA